MNADYQIVTVMERCMLSNGDVMLKVGWAGCYFAKPWQPKL